VDVDLDIALSNTLPRILAKTKVKPSEVLLIANSPQCIDIMQKVGFSIAYRPKDKILREVADKTISILPEILAIIE
jgi:3-deoxy-D-manno-octulosonate 8-phosphate phosphatase KdsC-like HAD superfamily phosphatase